MPTSTTYNEPFSQMPLNHTEHSQAVRLAITIGAVTVIIGMIYWWSTVGTTPATTTATQQSDIRAQIAAELRRSPVTVTQQQITSVASQLSTTKVTVTNAQKQAVANTLRSKITNF